ncbi:IS1096 element passenger TnpR family protein [Sphingomonas psychrolutea]|uniref:IS1096 element passenger TnpR family protein n=1 Tax=Sphingomonas psychrolutea TaxID=1259676 RepID=UPI00227AD08A|nr:hypothetical protein [Sphingomonas psychrolutea]
MGAGYQALFFPGRKPDSILQPAVSPIDPPIWRLVEVPTSITVKAPHDIIQVTIGCLDYHRDSRSDHTTYGLPVRED